MQAQIQEMQTSLQEKGAWCRAGPAGGAADTVPARVRPEGRLAETAAALEAKQQELEAVSAVKRDLSQQLFSARARLDEEAEQARWARPPTHARSARGRRLTKAHCDGRIEALTAECAVSECSSLTVSTESRSPQSLRSRLASVEGQRDALMQEADAMRVTLSTLR